MAPETAISFKDLVKELNKIKIKFLLIGRQAVILYGAPLMSFDYDLWVDPENKKKLLEYFIDTRHFKANHASDSRSLFFTIYAGSEKIDVSFYRKITNIEGAVLLFEESYKNATIITDPSDAEFWIRIPSIDDLIKLKRLRAGSSKDEEDIKYLLAFKNERGKTGH